MSEMSFSEAMKRIEALAPMCNFGKPSARCTDAELYYRRQYRWAVRAAHEGDNK